MSLPASQVPKIGRPLKTLVPLIQEELAAGQRAGLDHFRRAGEMLVEAKEQVAWGDWTSWLTKNFELSRRTADRYMRLVILERDEGEEARASRGANGHASLYAAIGEERIKTRAAWREVFKTADRVNVGDLAQERQAHTEETAIRRAMALELIDLGFKALATRLHPDRGGSRDAMTRLNDIRAELKSIATTRRFL